MGTRPPNQTALLSRRGRALLIVAVGFLALLLIGPSVVSAYVDWLWFGEVGFRSVWVTVLLTRLAIFVAVALMVGGTVHLALTLAYRSRPVFVPAAQPKDPIEPYRTQVMRRSRLFGWGVPVSVGVVCGLIAQSNWVTVQLFLHRGSFGIADPEFGHDIGYFVFELPFYQSVLNWLFVAVFLALLASVVTHYLFGGLRLTTGKGMLMRPGRPLRRPHRPPLRHRPLPQQPPAMHPRQRPNSDRRWPNYAQHWTGWRKRSTPTKPPADRPPGCQLRGSGSRRISLQHHPKKDK
jgi:hypothetical protein